MINQTQKNVMYSNLFAGLKIQFRVIYALIMREVLTRYGRHNIGFFWLIAEPILFTSGIAVAWSFGSALHQHRVGVLEFAVTGYSSILLWRNCSNRAVNGIQPSYDLLYHRRVRILDIFLARSLVEVIGATLSFSLISGVMIFLGYMQLPFDFGSVLVAWFLLIWIAISLGLVIGPISEISEILERVWHIVTYLFFPLSGAIFMVDWLSPTMRGIVLWIPMVNGLEMLRGAYFGPVVRPWYSISYIVAFCTITTLIGLSLVRYVAPRVTRK